MKALTNFMLKSAIAGGTFLGLGLLSAPAQAIKITYNFDGSFNGQSSVNRTVSGVTATFSNINGLNVFQSNSDGIYLNAPLLAGDRFDISFNQVVKFLSYSVTNNSLISVGETATFALSNPNGTSSTGNDLASVGSFDLSNQFILNAGQTSTLTASLSAPTSGETALIQSITVEAVPWETDALPVVGSTILFGFGVWTKRKSAKSLEK
jgi:hypothetical protein